MLQILEEKMEVYCDVGYTKMIKKAMKGDGSAYTEIIKKNKNYLYKMAFLYTKNEELALEVLQESVYKGFLNIRKLKKAQYFNTWITRILINAAIDMLKEREKIAAIDGDDCLLKSSKGISVEEKLDLYNAIDILRENYKTVIIMKYFNDMTINDIAKVMSLPEGTVKTYLARAKKELNSILKEGYLDE